MCVLVYARTHTPTAWVLDVSPGVGRTPGKPEEPRSTKAQYTCRPRDNVVYWKTKRKIKDDLQGRPYRCTKYICLYICWAAGFDDLG